MKLEFEKPTVQSFIRTNRGTFPLDYFTDEEINDYSILWDNRLKERKKEMTYSTH